jgi:nitrogen regulatory protein PII 2
MKEVSAIIRRDRVKATKEALVKAGFPSMHMCDVEGRGKQGGLRYKEAAGAGKVGIRFLPKKMLTIVARDEDVDSVVDTLIRANQTREIGDGKIFISPVNDTVRIRTGDRGEEAL